MIRVTRNGFLDRMSTELGRVSAELAKAEEQAVTGRKLNRPSDAPASLRQAERLDAASADQEIWKANASAASGVLDTLDNALSTATNILVRAQELATAGATETLSAADRLSMNVELLELMDEMRAVMNTDYAGRYVFGGTAWGAPPFDAADVYVGNTVIPESRVGTDRWVQTGLDGSAVFQGAVDILGTLNTLSAALVADNAVAVQATLTDLDAGHEIVVDARVTVGTYASTADDAYEVAGNLGVVVDQHLSALVDVDPIMAYSNLNRLKTAYTAALQVTASQQSRTLFDFLS